MHPGRAVFKLFLATHCRGVLLMSPEVNVQNHKTDVNGARQLYSGLVEAAPRCLQLGCWFVLMTLQPALGCCQPPFSCQPALSCCVLIADPTYEAFMGTGRAGGQLPEGSLFVYDDECKVCHQHAAGGWTRLQHVALLPSAC
jgi:hypothetical protein